MRRGTEREACFRSNVDLQKQAFGLGLMIPPVGPYLKQ